jgi:hypothetical protein
MAKAELHLRRSVARNISLFRRRDRGDRPQLLGRNKKEQTYNAYVLVGIGQLLLTGDASFDDRAARSLCEKFGCYNSANHSTHLREKGNEFTGTKERGWTLTAPGLKRGADLIKDMHKLNA